MDIKINIRPTTGVYATYKNIKYDPWTAIAEFVDNSTQSYYDNADKLKTTENWNKLNVEVIYEKDDKNGDKLIIKDNAYGMKFKDFQRAIVLDSPPEKATRSEFGMGLKTAACWFGTKWSVETTELGSGILYKACIDVDSLKKYKSEEVDVVETSCSPERHGTIITIENLNRKISGRQIGKTKDQLRGMYRSDIRNNEIEITYNGEVLQYEEPKVLTEELPNGIKKVWKKEIEFTVPYNDEELHVNGFVAIREKGSTSEAGFALLRKGRVIVGGYQNAYRPEEVFEKSNSYIYQRVFGELNLDDWPVTQTKDAFDWYSGLEDELINKLTIECQDYCIKAKYLRKRSKASFEYTTPDVTKSFQEAGFISNVQITNLPKDTSLNDDFIIKDNESNEVIIYDEETGQQNEDIIIEGSNSQEISFTIDNEDYVFNLKIEKNDPGKNWLKIKNISKNVYEIYWNIRHPFFKPYIDEPLFLKVMEKFVFAMALTEVNLRDISTDNKVGIEAVRMKMNDMLAKLSED